MTIIVAHRGASAQLPENTMPAYARAVEMGADAIELDVHLTADGQMAVIHDDTVDRTTDGSGAVAGMSMEQLRALDAGYRFTDGDGAFPHRGKGLTIPTRGGKFEYDLAGIKACARALKTIEEGKIDPSFVITHQMPLSQAPYGYKIFQEKQDGCIKIVLRPGT